MVLPTKHQNLNGSCYLTTPLSEMISHPRLGLATVNLPTKFEVSISALYEDNADEPARRAASRQTEKIVKTVT